MKRNRHAVTLGSVISGTLRPEDTVPAFADELARIVPRNRTEKVRGLLREARAYARGALAESYDALELANDLIDALNEHAPSLAYFGAHEGDGADFGFWVSSGALEDFDGLRVADTSEVPREYVGEVLHINDHGNATLYVKRGKRGALREVWGIV